MLWLVLAQSPSEYLGIEVGKTAVSQGSWVQVVMQQTYQGQIVDTEVVSASFDYNGHAAFSLVWAQHLTGDQSQDYSGTDTLWDNTPFLMDRGKVGDTPAELQWLKTPFSVGDKWGTGLEGTYQGEFDGDSSGTDVLEIRSDTIEVVGEEDVTVPAGTFHAFKLKETQTGALTQCSSVLIDSIVYTQVRYFWWSPGNWQVKDTVHQDFTAYVWGSPYPGTYDSYTELVSLTGVKEEAGKGLVKLLGSVAKGELALSLPSGFRGRISLYDGLGRLVLSEEVEGPRARLSLKGLRRGVYVLEVAGERFKLVKR